MVLNLSAQVTAAKPNGTIVPVSILTVAAQNNAGILVPNLNGSLLTLGTSYTLTAVAKPGFVFSNWVDGAGDLLTNKATLKFVMQSNLVLTANFLDTAKPTFSITNLAAGGSVSNAFYSLGGKAADNVAVAGVLYNLNNGGWQSAGSANGFTNWSATLPLLVGSNSISVYAVDTSGNVSATNKLTFTYVVSALLTVSTNGKGIILPAANGAYLQIGKNYSLTAIPASGFVFTNWTDGLGNIVTNQRVLTFLATSNLSFTANFIDVARPTLTVTAPTTYSIATNEFFAATGGAADNGTVSNVLYSVNGGGWFPANTTNGWVSWSATLGVNPGTNSFAAYAVDAAGNVSLTNTVRFQYDTAPQLWTNLQAIVTPDVGSPYVMYFGYNTFSQSSADTNHVNAVGGYYYTQLSSDTAQLHLVYGAPPSATNLGTQGILLTFGVPGAARYTITNNGTTGSMVFSNIGSLTQPFILGRTLVNVNSQGDAKSTAFSWLGFVSTDLIANTNIASTGYSYSGYGPVTVLLQLFSRSGTRYLLTTFQGTNYGSVYEEDYSLAGAKISSDNGGIFGIASQKTSGNAPTNLISRTAMVTLPDNSFQLMFLDATNFVDLNLTNNLITNGTGTYLYTRTGANAAGLSLNYVAPPESSAAALQFSATNFAIFTNLDRTYSTFILK